MKKYREGMYKRERGREAEREGKTAAGYIRTALKERERRDRMEV